MKKTSNKPVITTTPAAKEPKDERLLLIAPNGLTVFKNLAERNHFSAINDEVFRGTSVGRTTFTFSSRHAELSPFVPNAIGMTRPELWEAACEHAMTAEQRLEWAQIGEKVDAERKGKKTRAEKPAASEPGVVAKAEEVLIPIAPAGEIITTKPLCVKATAEKRARKPEHQDQKDQAKESVSAFMRAAIMAGKTNSDIFKEAKAKFGLDDKKSGYPAWYRSQMKRKGEA